MNEYEKTTVFKNEGIATESTIVTIFDGNQRPRQYDLALFHKEVVSFGRDRNNDIQLTSKYVSSHHGCFVYDGSKWVMQDNKSTNGLVYNDKYIDVLAFQEGDFVRIDGKHTSSDGVLFVFIGNQGFDQWKSVELNKKTYSIGRAADCDIVLGHVSISMHHAHLEKRQDGMYIIDDKSTNGVIINGIPLNTEHRLAEKDVILITNTKMIYSHGALYFYTYKSGISVDGSDVVIVRGKGNKKFITCNHVNVHVNPGELVGIIGGSGAGKSTILNALSGYLKPNEGQVYINGVDLYQNFDRLKRTIGYVPQSDIVYDNLTLHDMLMYTAQLRLPSDTSKEEYERAIDRAIEIVDLKEKKQSYIRALSGGQKKRASIAVELLSDPNLLFLDEPASGLDPGTERTLMKTLRNMSDDGKTILLVTHSTLCLNMCDKIIFMGNGGNLCFYGSLEESYQFFGVDNVVDIYEKLNNEAKEWSQRFARQNGKIRLKESITPSASSTSTNVFKQLQILSARYMKLVANDRMRLLLILLQAPLLAYLISLVADGEEFVQYEMTKSLLFALSCSAFWIGMLNSIQEICKERTILHREYMAGLSLSAYIGSKILVLGLLCMVQSVLLVGVFSIFVSLPEEGVKWSAFLEMLITTWLTAMSAAGMGLFVSSLFKNADRAMTVAPILLMPQILFSGLLFKLSGFTEKISYFATCRWSMEGYGTTANLNDLVLRMEQEYPDFPIEHEVEDFFEFTFSHLCRSWWIMLGSAILFLIIGRILLKNIQKN